MDNNKDTSYKLFINKKKSKKKEKLKNIDNKKNIFLSKTFASKLFLKLTSKIIDPVIVCLQTLKFEPENRKKEEIENTIPYLKTLDNFKDYVKFREKEKSSFDLMVKFAKITYYQYYRKNTILKRAGTTNDKFFILLNGTINKFSLVFEKRNLTLEQYLLYLVKLDIICENEIIKKCHILNKSTMNIIGDESISNYFNNFKKIKYNDILSKAEKELIDKGFNNDLYQGKILKRIPSIENYLKLFDCNYPKKIMNDVESKFNVWIGKYKLSSILIKGQFFNNISDEIINENYLYLCKTNCDIGQISRDEFIEEELNLSIKLKMENLFKEIKNNFYFFRGINDDKFIKDYSHLMLYKKYKKGDKIFLQGGLYEGVYLVYDGEISLSTKTSLDKLGQLLINVIYSIKSFSEHIPIFNSLELIEEFNEKHKLLYTIGDLTLKEFQSIKKLEISTNKKNDILGLNELYDYKTEIFNFTAECKSDEATLIFITKNDFSILMGREISLYNAIVSTVEYKIQYIVGKIRSFSEQTLIAINVNNNRKNREIKNYSTSNIYNNDKKNIFNNSNIKFNTSKINNDKKLNNNTYNTSNSSITTYFSNKNYKIRPLILSNFDRQKNNKNQINSNKNNYENNLNYNNENESMSLFYKTLNTRRNNYNSNSYKSDYMKYNSLNNGSIKKRFRNIDSINNINNNKSSSNFNSTNLDIFNCDKLVNFNTFREKKEKKYNNEFQFHLNYNKKNRIMLYPTYEEKINSFEKIKLFPVLKSRYLNNSNLKNKKIIYK